MSDVPLDPWVPRPLDRPRVVEAGAELDTAKILAAPADPAEWPGWRETLRRWRDDARIRTGHTGELYDRPEFAWTQTCFSVALVWLWDELLYDFERGDFTPERLVEFAGDFGGFDGITLDELVSRTLAVSS